MIALGIFGVASLVDRVSKKSVNVILGNTIFLGLRNQESFID